MTDKSKKPARFPKLPKLSRKQIREGLDSIPMDTILLGVGKSRELTHKQKQFARNVALGKTKAQAYRESYNTKATPNTIGTEVARLSQNPRIAQEIEAYKLAKEAEDYRNPADLRRLVIHQLTIHALNEEVNPAQRIKSLELLGKVAGVDVFQESKVTTVIHQSGDIKARLLSHLKSVIDVETTEREDKGDSLIQELTHRNTADSAASSDPLPGEPTPGGDPQTGPSDTQSYTHTIPHNKSSSESTQSVQCKDTTVQDVDFIEEKNEVETLPQESTSKNDSEGVVEGEGVDDFWVQRGLDIEGNPPAGDLK